MTIRRQNAVRPRQRRAPTAGLVLTEAALLLLVVLLAGWLGVELLGRARQQQRCDQFARDLRDIAAAFQQFAREPASRAARPPDGTLPPALAARLRATNWFNGSPFGGTYEWRPPAAPMPAPARPSSEAGATAAAKRGAEGGGAAPALAKSVAPPPPPKVAARGSGAIALTAFPPERPLRLSRADLVRIDQQLDDGNPASGRFRAGFNGWPVYTPDGP